ncbi:hypothetical protein AVEN_190901-1 [Araneus ventricosus]|uniref:Uncharacterized protein n=1 Tax=Araneus ventricosus TaxID=182803 RepID=A0A4Y2CQK2_ARAVE|nr:hypothetical protein AVEN_190901-1 [Araneus ventricosus]
MGKAEVLPPDSNFSLEQSCRKFDTARVQVRNNEASHHKSNLPEAYCIKLIANYSKSRVRRQTSDSNPQQPTETLLVSNELDTASLLHGDYEACENLFQACCELAVLPCQTCYKIAATLLQTKIAIWALIHQSING